MEEEKIEKHYTLVFCRRKDTETSNDPALPSSSSSSSSSSSLPLSSSSSSSGCGSILLGMKKRGFGAGKWNGFGGKIEGDEFVEQAARRELMEECSLNAITLNRLGYLVFNMEHMHTIMRVHVFDCWDFEGEPTESDEMRPQWYREDEIPFDRMWPDDIFWFDYLKSRTQFIGSFTFEDDETITESTVRAT